MHCAERCAMGLSPPAPEPCRLYRPNGRRLMDRDLWKRIVVGIGITALIIWAGFQMPISGAKPTTVPPVAEVPAPTPLPIPPRRDRFPTVVKRTLMHEGGATYT